MSIRFRPLATICFTLIFLLSLGCASHLVRTAGQEPTSSVEDPREDDPWFAAGRRAVARSSRNIQGQSPARNVILFVGDGMGISTVTAARILEGQRRGESGEDNSLAFEALSHLALAKTYSVDSQVSDSASTITAIVAGVKTRTGVLGVNADIRLGDHTSVEGTRVLTILEEAEMRGLSTGIVTTTTVTHATPAGCYAHVPLRVWEDDSRMPREAREEGFPDIARQLVEFSWGDGLEVVLGGGRSHFTASGVPDPEDASKMGGRLDGRNLTDEWLDRYEGSAYVWNSTQFTDLDLANTSHLLGLFQPADMNWESDRATDTAGEPSLAEMTRAALEILSRDEDGFFLMVEGGRIDHGHHGGNAERALSDTIALSDAVRVALESTDPRETLVVVTADHSHTLTIAGYPKRGNPILGLVASTGFMSDDEESLALDALGKPYTTLSYANGPGYTGASKSQPEGPHHWRHRPCPNRPPRECNFEGITTGRPDLTSVDTENPNYLQESTVPMSHETHAGEDVPIFAGGARAALFHGVREQNYIYHAMVEALGWTRSGRPVD